MAAFSSLPSFSLAIRGDGGSSQLAISSPLSSFPCHCVCSLFLCFAPTCPVAAAKADYGCGRLPTLPGSSLCAALCHTWGFTCESPSSRILILPSFRCFRLSLLLQSIPLDLLPGVSRSHQFAVCNQTISCAVLWLSLGLLIDH